MLGFLCASCGMRPQQMCIFTQGMKLGHVTNTFLTLTLSKCRDNTCFLRITKLYRILEILCKYQSSNFNVRWETNFWNFERRGPMCGASSWCTFPWSSRILPSRRHRQALGRSELCSFWQVLTFICSLNMSQNIYNTLSLFSVLTSVNYLFCILIFID